MSKILKGIGKVFRKVAKVVKKVLPYALMAAAVVFTGGAALSVLPTFAGAVGSVVGGLGLSAGLTTALTGAVTGAGFGALAGGVVGGEKGMFKGMLMGGAAGGLFPTAVPGVGGAMKAASASGALAPGSALSNSIMSLPSEGAAAAASGGISPAAIGSSALGASAPSAAASSLVPTAGGATGGLGGMFGGNPLLASTLLGGVADVFAPNEYVGKARAEAEERRRLGYFAFGGGDINGKKKGGIIPGVYSQGDNPFGIRPYAAPPSIQPTDYAPASLMPRWEYDPATNKVVEVQAQ
jgi:hypothetical protein